METRVDSLAALVQCAIMRPTDSVDSLASDSSQTTAVHSQSQLHAYSINMIIVLKCTATTSVAKRKIRGGECGPYRYYLYVHN